MYEDFETMQMRAWPALEEEWLGSWRLRFSRGFSNRANSATPLGGAEASADLDRIEKTEERYRSRGLPPCFKLRDDHECAALDAALTARGYGLTHPTLVKTARLAESAAALGSREGGSAPERADVSFIDGFTEAWVRIYSALNQRTADADPYWRTLSAVRARARSATVLVDGEPVAAGSAIFDLSADTRRAGAWVGFYDLAVAKDQRGRGYGKVLLGSLIADAMRLGYEHGYLAVMEGNAPALALYAKAGFADLYRYWYRKAAS
jgi:ribosomal protein S18 acetylase RimI-like enzyme